jgi:hypothetical protein
MTTASLTASPHAKPAAATIVGAVVGVLTLLEGFFGSGHMPSGAEIASILAGSGITLGSVGAFIGSHLGITKAQMAHDAALVAEEWTKAEPLLATVEQAVPALQAHMASLETAIDDKVKAAVAALPAVVQPDAAALASEVEARVRAAIAGAPSAPASAQPAAAPGPVG